MTEPREPTSTPLDDARAAVQRSDQAAGRIGTRAMSAETRAIRDSLRALIQHVEQLEERIAVREPRGPW
jgi:transcription elongation GreA/GreB family factor